MTVLFFDVEADGLDPDVLHCIVTMDARGEFHRYSHEDGNFRSGLETLAEADEIIGHNITGYDLWAIQKLYPDWKTKAEIVDTLVLSRLCWPNLKELDYKNQWGDDKEYKKGSHALGAWGVRLGFEKWTHLVEGPDAFEKWSMDLEDYCERDVEITHRLFREITKMKPSGESCQLEHQIAILMEEMSRHGFLFDRERGEKLYARLVDKQTEMVQELQELFPPTMVELKTKTKVVPFNPGSRKQIADRFMEKGWVPKEFTPDGRPKISEIILMDLAKDFPEAGILNVYLLNQKRLGQLAEGPTGWLGMLDSNDRLHGRVISGGTVSGRMSHHSPNMANVCGEQAYRELFIVPEGKMLLGCDASGLELRCAAHYMSAWDDGAYGRVIESGDIHTANMEAAGLTDRNQAKTMIYAMIYGAGDQRLGMIVGGDRKEGRELRRRFMDKVPAFKKLTDAVKSKAESEGYLMGLDGRKLFCRSAHSALNLLLQSAGALAMKRATVLFDKAMSFKGFKRPEQWAFVAHVHDEFQAEVDEGIADTAANLAVQSIQDAGVSFKLNVPLDGESKLGKSWWDAH